jgi:hypothetical protein
MCVTSQNSHSFSLSNIPQSPSYFPFRLQPQQPNVRGGFEVVMEGTEVAYFVQLGHLTDHLMKEVRRL